MAKKKEPAVVNESATEMAFRSLVVGGCICEWRETTSGIEVRYDGGEKTFPNHERFQDWLANF